MTVSQAAYAWQASGVSTIPIMPNKSKRPLVRWKEYQLRLPLDGEMSEWWGNGHEYGLALIMGHVSGNLEMLELESRATSADQITEIMNRCDELGVGHIWDLLNSPDGYSEMSPSGGLHFIYHIVDEPVPGNEKVANAEDGRPLAETRGEGGYVIVAPSSGLCHPSGDSWVKLTGEYGRVASVTWEQRQLLHQAIRGALHFEAEIPVGTNSGALVPVPVSPSPSTYSQGAGLRPGDAFEAATDWSDPDLLGGAGWHLTYTMGTTRHWTRPGKDPRDGISATTGHDAGRDRLFVFSTSTVFPSEEPITKFRAFSLLHHRGDDSAAASALAHRGFGDRGPLVGLLDDRNPGLGIVPDFPVERSIDGSKAHDLSDRGSAMQIKERLGDIYRFVQEENEFYRFNGSVWEVDLDHVKLYWDVGCMAEEMTASPNPVIAKYGLRLQNDAPTQAVCRAFKTLPGITVSASEFNTMRHLLNVKNGTINLRTGEFGPHRAEDMITQKFSATYDPQAQCPKFDEFIEQVLPEPNMRNYVQRAVGATMLGDAGQRAVFLVHGPSGTGKTQFLELMKHLFGSYGVTAPASTFRSKRDGAPPYDLHRLRGRRFVATSETSDSASFDEEVIKRLTGGDSVSSRSLYERYQDWIPECDIWMATNFPPKFNSDDDAMWRRSKLIPFTTVFGDAGAPRAIPNYARNVLFDEADGILNWMLAGLRDYLANGLQEPEAIAEAAVQLRLESDSVARFVEEQVEEGLLFVDPAARMRTSDIMFQYQEWARRNYERPVGKRRFMNRLTAAVPVTREKVGGQMWCYGLGRPVGAGVFGLIAPAERE